MYIWMQFEWDENKNRANLEKHGVDFGNAITIFSDPLYVSWPERNMDGEERFLAVGVTKTRLLVLAVAYTERDDSGEEITRIISARKATPSERKRYEEGE